MYKILELRMLCDENDLFVRDYQISDDNTLLDLHQFICKDMDYDTSEICSFYAADELWTPLQEFASEKMDPEQASMSEVKLSALLSSVGHKLIYMFDMLEERGLFLQVVGITEEESDAAYPRITASEGEAPDQFEPDFSGGGSIFDDAMEDYGGYGGDDGYDQDE
ncbi:MAG: hypothetical protein R3Y15_06580 [Rikenellaceae bacterium]